MAIFVKGDKIKPLVVLEEDMVEQEMDGLTAIGISKDKYPNLCEYLYVSFGDIILTRQLGGPDGESGMYSVVYHYPYPQEEGEPSDKTLTYSMSYSIMGVSGDGNYYLCIPAVTTTFVTKSNDEQLSSIELSRAATYEGYELSEDIKNNFKQNIGISGGADWNAQPGEAGYIENRTHYVTGTGVDLKYKTLDEVYIPDTIARKSDIPVPIIINYNTIKDAANSEVNTISEQTWLKYIANDTYKNYDWIIQRDGIKYNCTVIPDYDNKHIQILYFTRNEIEGTSGPLGNAIMKYSGLRIQLLPYTENTYLIYKISNGGSLETREFVFGENYNNNAYLIAAAQMSGIDTIDCKWVYTTKADKTITVNGQYFHIENSITNVDAIFSVKDKSLTYVDGNGLINKVTFADNGSYDISKNNPDIPDTVVKTTPQTLSDTDKNQALANLGIDPVVWKYMCNPYVIDAGNSGGTIPEELVSIIFNDNGYLRPIVQKLIVFLNGPINIWYENELYGSDDSVKIAIDTNGTWHNL